jgi:hypothetical protein
MQWPSWIGIQIQIKIRHPALFHETVNKADCFFIFVQERRIASTSGIPRRGTSSGTPALPAPQASGKDWSVLKYFFIIYFMSKLRIRICESRTYHLLDPYPKVLHLAPLVETLKFLFLIVFLCRYYQEG